MGPSDQQWEGTHEGAQACGGSEIHGASAVCVYRMEYGVVRPSFVASD